MVDVGRDDCAACGHLGTDKLGRDLRRDALREASEDGGGVGAVREVLKLARSRVLLAEFVAGVVAGEVGERGPLGAAHVLTDGDELHLRGDDSLAGIPELGDGMAGGGTEGLALAAGEAGELDQAVPLGGAGILGVLAGEVAVVHRLDFTSFIRGHITPLLDPSLTHCRETLRCIAFEIRITPGARAVVDADGGVGLQLAGEVLGGRECDLAHRDAHLGVDGSPDIDTTAGGECVGALGFEVGFGGDHKGEGLKG